MRTIQLASILAINLFAAETPFDLIRPVYPMAWDTSAVTEGGTVYDFKNFSVNEKDTLVGTPKSGSKPEEFKANAYISDTLNQAYIDALNLKIGDIRVNQAGYLPDDPEKRFYYITNSDCFNEIYSIAQRLRVAKLLSEKKTYMEIAQETNASTATISRINKCLVYGADGYKRVLERLSEKENK